MLAFQGIFRVAIMIEFDRFPILLFMTSLAFGAEIILVLVILLVATDTGRGKLLFLRLQFGRMAGIAFGRYMLAQQRKFGVLVMIELGGLPFLFGVAGFALGTQTALVHIVLAVTLDTRRRRFHFAEQRRLVAGDTFYFDVLAQ